jgi:hypothetical protein
MVARDDSGLIDMRFVALLIMCAAFSAAPGAEQAPADLSGIWMPDSRRAEPWPDPLPLTAEARRQMDAFDPATRDPASFCMPFGTPRNTLSTEFPLEIVQTPARLTMIVQPDLSNVEVRRIDVDGRVLPKEPDPSWFGTSVGKWEGATLVVETVGIETDVIVSSTGLPHSDALRIEERLSVVRDPERGKVLVDEMTLHDTKAYTKPLKVRRYFTWAPNAQMRESHCGERLWIEKLWRDRLEEHATAARKKETGK